MEHRHNNASLSGVVMPVFFCPLLVAGPEIVPPRPRLDSLQRLIPPGSRAGTGKTSGLECNLFRINNYCTDGNRFSYAGKEEIC